MAKDRAPTIQPGDRVLAHDAGRGEDHLIVLDGGGARKQRGLGVFDPGRLAGMAWGSRARIGDKELVLLPPRLPDLGATLARKAQIILPKDLSRIVYELGVADGDRVLESGIGSGAATMALAHAVGDRGRVVVQELREDFRDWAVDNLRRAGLDGRVEVHLGDLTQGLAASAAAAGPFDAVLLDQPEPWLAAPHLAGHLAPGARIACYTPQVSQMENTVRALQAQGFADVRALELIERAWEVKERGSRPSFEGLGHTAFLAFARWLGPAPAPSRPSS